MLKYKDTILFLILTQVTVGENEGIESALRRFKRQVSKAGIFADLKRLRHCLLYTSDAADDC